MEPPPDQELELIWDYIRKKQEESGETKFPALKTPNSIKTKLYELFDDYQLPWKTIPQYWEYHKIVTSKIRKVAKEKQDLYNARGWTYTDTALEDVKDDKRSIITSKGISKGYDFLTKQYNEHPLVYQEDITMDKFRGAIEFFGDSNLISLPGSLTKMLDFSQKKGLDYPLLSELFFIFIQDFFKELLPTAYTYRSEENAAGLFKILVERIDLSEERNKISKARHAIIRNPEDNIQETMTKVRSLAQQLLLITNPDMLPDKREWKSGAIALMDVESFISEKCYLKFKEFSNQRMANGHQTDFTLAIRKIQQWEEDPEVKITSPRKLKSNLDQAMMLSLNQEGVAVNQALSNGWYKNRDSRGEKRGSREAGGGRGRGSGRSFDRRRSFSRTPSSSSRGSSFDRTSRSRSNSQESNRSQHKSPTGDKYRNNSQSRGTFRGSFKANESPKSYRKGNNLIDVKNTDRCYKCYAKSHQARQCFRYLATSKRYCGHCAKKIGVKLYHDDQYCRFKRSDYKSPTPATRERRMNSFMKKESSKTNLN